MSYKLAVGCLHMVRFTETQWILHVFNDYSSRKVIGISKIVCMNVAVTFRWLRIQLLKCAKFLGWGFPIPCNTTLS